MDHRRPTWMLAALAVVSTFACSSTDPDERVAGSIAPPTPRPAVSSAPVPTPPDTPAPASDGALVVWARGDLPASFATSVAGLTGVVAATHVRGATLGLTATRDDTGGVHETFADGFRVPVEVVALDPAAYAATLDRERSGRAEQQALERLVPGEVLLTETGAALRGAAVGWELDIGGAEGLVVAAIVADEVTGRAEIVAHAADADRLGLDADGTVFIRHEAAPGIETAQLVAAVEREVPDGLTARVVEVGVTGERRRAPLVLSLPQVKDRFGEFAFRPGEGRGVTLAPGFVDEHIVTVDVPLLGRVTCHRAIIDDLRGALDDIVAAGLSSELDPDGYAGCFNPRRISASGDRLSHHAWGIALDVNVDLTHPDGGEPPHPGVVDAFERHGFRWGGDFIHPDNHHFEWVGSR